MRDYVLKTNRLTLDATLDDGHTVIAASRPGAMHLATGTTCHLSMNADAVVTHADAMTKEGDKYLHEGNLATAEKAVMGVAHTEKAETYAPGLVPAGAAYEEGDQHLFLSKNGQWGVPSPHVGAVYENFLALSDTPNNYTLKHGQYLKVDQNKLVFTDIRDDISSMDFTQLSTSALRVTSDENSKFEIATCDDDDLSASIDITNKIPMVRFRYKEGDGREKLGFLAQTVEKCYGQAVSQGEQYKQVDFTQMLALCMANVKSLITQLGAIDARVTKLDEGISTILEKYKEETQNS